jgi:hypothetical protein
MRSLMLKKTLGFGVILFSAIACTQGDSKSPVTASDKQSVEKMIGEIEDLERESATPIVESTEPGVQ